MVKLNLIRELDLNEDNWEQQVVDALNGALIEESDWGGQDVAGNQITEGKIVRIENEFVIVDIGYKSEGIVPLNEWEEGEAPPVPGEMIKVLIEEIEDEIEEDTEETGEDHSEGA